MPLHGQRNVIDALQDLQVTGERNIKAVAFNLFTNIIEGTPVDTGRARSNWFLSEGIPSKRTTNRTRRRANLDKIIRSAPGDKRWFLTNNLPYIEKLEYEGASSQARLGWVRRSIKRMRVNIKRGRL